MEFDNPAAGGQWGSQHNSDSDFSDSETGGGSSKKEKTILGSAKKKDKEKKREKEKETKYAHLGEDSSNDDEDGGKGSTGKSKKKAFKIGLAKKEKKDKKEKEAKEKDLECKELKEAKDAKKKEKKDKPKLKLKKSKHTDSESDKNGKSEETKWPPIFGVPLQLAVERNRCHDGIQLPVVVRECIDFIEEHGLHVEGIYRSSGVKSKIVKLRTAYSSRQPVVLSSADPPVVASLLKLFLRELPDPVLTQKLIPNFEEVSKRKVPLQRLEGLRGLLQELPEPNLRLIQWVFVHMGHVIKKEKLNKMTLQNVSIVLSPTMQISHRVLNCIFEHAEDLFAGVALLRYIPPLCGPGAPLPESPGGIAEEMRKQESLLAELHREISSGLVVSRAREEQLWEQQRIVTQLKRNLRVAKSRQEEPVTYEEELNFALQIPLKTSEEGGAAAAEVASGAGTEGAPSKVTEGAPSKVTEGAPSLVIEGATPLQGAPPRVTEGALPRVLSSPDDGTDRSQEHRITVQIHQERREAQGLQESGGEGGQDSVREAQEPEEEAQVTVREAQGPQASVREASKPHVTVIQLNPSVEAVEATAAALQPPQPGQAGGDAVLQPPGQGAGESVHAAVLEAEATRPAVREAGDASSSCSPPVRQTSAPGRVEGEEERVRGGVSFSSTGLPSSRAPATAAIPLLPPPPPSSKTSCRAAPQRCLAPPEPRLKSKSLPRGLPSDGVYDGFEHSAESAEEAKRSALLLEEMRLRFEFEEMMNLKSELERRRKTERREIAELQEEIATMQTLYQYRTYSVDSSEESSEEEDGRSQEQRAARLGLLRRLVAEKKQLEASKVEMQDRLQEERAACLQLRVNIRMEQERIKRRAANF